MTTSQKGSEPKPGYQWQDAGEEWSAPWGSSKAQWSLSILPRIRRWIPTGSILEIAPGFGRWTYYLRKECRHLEVVDLDPACVAACRRRFGDDPHLVCHLNDGRSLAMVPDESIDFVFSFDSLVHAPQEAVAAYLRQLPAKLKKDGVGFIHHSNLGHYASSRIERLPRRLKKLLIKAKLWDSGHGRAPDMTAELFRSLCEDAGLKCLRQEVINWRSRRLIDCFTTFAPEDSKWEPVAAAAWNPGFMREARMISQTFQD